MAPPRIRRVIPVDWRKFLTGWGAEVLAADLADAFSAEERASGCRVFDIGRPCQYS